ncbi:hypothetical protein [Mucilaginibacter xinganensis]|uniref:Uncharacterized protein n=1 Tax=Mucilaginibacter xinganensis TaxID=1234841 RepID=A0A223P0V0_9SPHI|nr:hypothetical protein [Mucilaginibacter xinganensis]ASU35574.1 hypothetical protein MuYL_3689 [Mucilaginibacter xinganensis]
MSNPKYRSLYLMIAFAGFIFLAYDVLIAFPDINPLRVLLIAFPDMVFFYLAYKTYPVEEYAAANSGRKIKSY